MGVEFNACNKCGDTFYEGSSRCKSCCGLDWCSSECAKAEGFREEPKGFKQKGSIYSQETSCNFCRKEDFSDTELLNFLVNSHNSSRQEVVEMYKEHLENEGDES